jgi:hypothetical protein
MTLFQASTNHLPAFTSAFTTTTVQDTHQIRNIVTKQSSTLSSSDVQMDLQSQEVRNVVSLSLDENVISSALAAFRIVFWLLYFELHSSLL